MNILSNFKNINYTKKKGKGFAYFFSFILLLISIYSFFFLKKISIGPIVAAIILILLAKYAIKTLKAPTIFWEMIGIFLGIIFSPIILTVIYCATIVPINFLIRILGKDLINLKFSEKKTYWVNRKNKNITFKNQF